MLFSLGLGMGVPLLLLVTLGNRFLPRPGAWMNRVKGVFGFVFLGMALYTLRSLLPAALLLALSGALLIALAWAAWPALQRLPALRALPLLGALWGGLLLVGRQPVATTSGSRCARSPVAALRRPPASTPRTPSSPSAAPEDLQRELDAAKAQAAGDARLLCRLVRVVQGHGKQVFARSDVQAGLAGVQLLRLDVTADTPASQALLQRYQVPGPPSIIWVGPEGDERRARRITGEVDAAAFLQHWTQTRSQG